MRPEETSYKSPLEKPLNQLTDEDISQLTREDCRRYLKEKGMRRPSWNKSQAIQQVLSLKSLLETRSDSGAGTRKVFVSCRTEDTEQHVSPVSAAEDTVPYRRKDPPKPSFSGNMSARLPATDNNKSIPTNPNRIRSLTNEPLGQMTIFYHGKVNVYDDVSTTKARAIMQLAGSPICLPQDSPPGVNTTIGSFPCYLQAASDRPGSSSPASISPSLQTSKVAEHYMQHREEGSMSHEVEPADVKGPASRKASLQRYLEKRKDRQSSRHGVYSSSHRRPPDAMWLS